MGLLEDAFKGWTGVAVGLGAAYVAPTIASTIRPIVRPVAKGLINGGMAVGQTLREDAAEATEQLGDLFAEARAERESHRLGDTTAAARGRRTWVATTQTTPPDTAAAVDYGTLTHVLPGRIRLRIQSVRSDETRAAEVGERLSTLDTVTYASANPRSGSVLVEYEPDVIGSGDLIGRMADALGLEITGDAEPHARDVDFIDSNEAAARIRALAERANRRVAGLSGGVDLRVLVPGVLFCLGAGALLGARRRRMPEWYTLLWCAFGAFQTLNRPGPRS